MKRSNPAQQQPPQAPLGAAGAAALEGVWSGREGLLGAMAERQPGRHLLWEGPSSSQAQRPYFQPECPLPFRGAA